MDKWNRVGVFLAIIIIVIAALSFGFYLIGGGSVSVSGSASEVASDVSTGLYAIKGVPLYAEFHSDRVIITYLETEDSVIQSFIRHLPSSITTEDGSGILVLFFSSGTPSDHAAFLSAEVSSFNELPDSEVISEIVE